MLQKAFPSFKYVLRGFVSAILIYPRLPQISSLCHISDDIVRSLFMIWSHILMTKHKSIKFFCALTSRPNSLPAYSVDSVLNQMGYFLA